MKNTKKTVNSLSRVCYALLGAITGAIFASLIGIDPLWGASLFACISILSPLPAFDGTLYTVTQNPLIGRAKNKAGGMVFTTWKGKNVIKTKPLTVAQPSSETRDMQQSIVRQLVAIGRPILGLIRKAFREVSTGSTEWASYVKYNAPEAFDTSSPPTATLTPNTMTLSKGTLINPSDIAGVFASRVFNVDWTDNSSESGNSSTDLLNAFVITAAGEQYSFTEFASRDDASGSFTIPGSTATTAFAVYCWFSTPSGSKSGDSVLLDPAA